MNADVEFPKEAVEAAAVSLFKQMNLFKDWDETSPFIKLMYRERVIKVVMAFIEELN